MRLTPSAAPAPRRGAEPLRLEKVPAASYIRRMGQIGRYLLLAGVLIAAAGVLMIVGERFGLGRLPGDIVWRRKHTTVYFPIVTSVVLSLVLTVLLNLWFRRK
jgi:hypothetical protein